MFVAVNAFVMGHTPETNFKWLSREDLTLKVEHFLRYIDPLLRLANNCLQVDRRYMAVHVFFCHVISGSIEA